MRPLRPLTVLAAVTALIVTGSAPGTADPMVDPAVTAQEFDDVQGFSAELAPVAEPLSTVSVADQRAGDGAAARTASLETPVGITIVGLTWEGDDADAVASLRVRDGEEWSAWEAVDDVVALDENDPSAGYATEGTMVVDADEVQVELVGDVPAARVQSWTSTVTDEDRSMVAELPPATSGSSGSRGFPVATRSQWGADESVTGGPWLGSGERLGITLHHTVTQATYPPQQVPAMLRSIHHYHAVTLNWGDIGYHMLVDQHGRLWEGRAGGIERVVRGAHAFGMNTPWFGIAALGNHQTTPVSTMELGALGVATGWAMNQFGAQAHDQVRYTNDALGWTRLLPVIHGHRDVDSTLCPGLHMFAVMGQLRTMAAAEQGLDRLAYQRVGGADRYASAAALAREANLGGTRTAYLATGADDALADALGVGPVAAAGDAAVVLTQPNQLSQSTRGALGDLGTRDVVIVGGDQAVSPQVQQQLVTEGYQVRRVEGANRVETAVSVSRERAYPTGGTVYLAQDHGYADALGGAAAAAEQDAPMLLTQTGLLPAATAARLQELQPSRVVVVGGNGAVSNSVLNQVRASVPGATVNRVGGDNRFITNALVALDAFGSASNAVVANGSAPVDAIAGTQLAADRGGPVLLARQNCLPASVRGTIGELGIGLNRLAGGSSVLAESAGWQGC